MNYIPILTFAGPFFSVGVGKGHRAKKVSLDKLGSALFYRHLFLISGHYSACGIPGISIGSMNLVACSESQQRDGKVH